MEETACLRSNVSPTVRTDGAGGAGWATTRNSLPATAASQSRFAPPQYYYPASSGAAPAGRLPVFKWVQALPRRYQPAQSRLASQLVFLLQRVELAFADEALALGEVDRERARVADLAVLA